MSSLLSGGVFLLAFYRASAAWAGLQAHSLSGIGVLLASVSLALSLPYYRRSPAVTLAVVVVALALLVTGLRG